MSRRNRAQQPHEISKAVVAVAPPRLATSIYGIGDGRVLEYRVNPTKRARYAIYYEMYRQHPTVRAAIEKVSKTTVANGYRFVPVTHGEVIPPAKLDYLKKFFRQSNAGQLLRLTYKDILIYGEAFWLIVGAKGGGTPIKAMRLNPRYIDPHISNGVLLDWRYGPVMSDGSETITYELGEIIHFTLDDPNSETAGLSLLESLQNTVASDLFAIKYNEKFFENSASSGLILSMKSSDIGEVKRNREWLDQNYVGTDNAHRPIILEGDIGVNKAGTTSQEMEFIAGRKLNREEILSALDVDPTKVGIHEHSNRSNAKESDNTFRTETVAPLQSIVEDEISNSFILGMLGWDDVLFEQQESAPRDQLDQMSLFKDAIQTGIFSINDVLDQLGRPHVPGGDTHFIQTAAGLVPLDQVENVSAMLLQQNGTSPQLGAGSGIGTDDPPEAPDQADVQDAKYAV